jgi:hypothetical protein
LQRCEARHQAFQSHRLLHRQAGHSRAATPPKAWATQANLATTENGERSCPHRECLSRRQDAHAQSRRGNQAVARSSARTPIAREFLEDLNRDIAWGHRPRPGCPLEYGQARRRELSATCSPMPKSGSRRSSSCLSISSSSASGSISSPRKSRRSAFASPTDPEWFYGVGWQPQAKLTVDISPRWQALHRSPPRRHPHHETLVSASKASMMNRKSASTSASTRSASRSVEEVGARIRPQARSGESLSAPAPAAAWHPSQYHHARMILPSPPRRASSAFMHRNPRRPRRAPLRCLARGACPHFIIHIHPFSPLESMKYAHSPLRLLLRAVEYPAR